MPPLNDIQSSVAVARSRGMRYFFFIQSFSQIEQVYGKETASIIIDNCALCYLKTNSVECAEVIAKKLGKSTITTSSISSSTDPFKIGANKTTSLLGRELLTANEIIALKYKTIIFPVFGNPIFRDTYMYSDLYPQYKNVDIIHSAEEAKNMGVQRAKQELNNQIKDPESILNEQVDVSQGGGYVEVEVTYEVQENIGTKEKIVF